VTEPARLILDALSDLRIHTLKCEAPLNGRLVFGPPEGAFDVPRLAYDLDTAETSAQSVDKDGRLRVPTFTEVHYRESNEPRSSSSMLSLPSATANGINIDGDSRRG
jgi:hypothetical protein